jgi:hypothetical protein
MTWILQLQQIIFHLAGILRMHYAILRKLVKRLVQALHTYIGAISGTQTIFIQQMKSCILRAC